MTQERWARTVEAFGKQGEAQQLKLPDDPQVARALLHSVRLERTRQFGAYLLGLELSKRLELDRFFEQPSMMRPPTFTHRTWG